MRRGDREGDSTSSRRFGQNSANRELSRSANQTGDPRMDNLRSIVLGVVSSLIAAGIIALARSNRRWFTACGRALTVANLAL